MRTPLLLIFLFLIHGVALSQADSILRLPPAQQMKALWVSQHYHVILGNTKDSTKQLAIYQELEATFNAHGRDDLAQQVWLMRNIYRATLLYIDSPLSVAISRSAIDEAHHNGWEALEAECMISSGLVHFQQQNYGPAFDQLLRGYQKLKELGFDKYPHTLRHVSNLAHAYYHFEDYPAALAYLKETLTIPPPWNENGFHRQTLNTVGLCFQKMMQYDSAIHYFQLAHDASLAAGDTFWAALSDGNTAQAYVLNGKDDAALPLLKTDHTQSIRSNEIGSALTSAMELASIYIRRNLIDTAMYYQEFIRRYVNPKDFRSMSRYYRNRYEIEKLRGDFSAAAISADSLNMFRDSIVHYDDTHLKNRITRQVAVEQYSHQIRALEDARSRQVLLRNALLAILLLSGAIVALWINRQNLKRRKEQEVLRMQQQVAEEGLRRAQVELSAFTETLRQKNALIDSFQAEIEAKRNIGSPSDQQGRAEQISVLLNATILTEDEWKEFRRMFDKVHPGFFGVLKERYPDLTPADLRLLALTRLKLAPREMMSMLGVSYDAIKKARKRLLSRLELPAEESLGAFVEAL